METVCRWQTLVNPLQSKERMLWKLINEQELGWMDMYVSENNIPKLINHYIHVYDTE